MTAMSLSALLAGVAPVDGADPLISGLAIDSRKVEPGTVFLACRGTESHGLNFLDDAVRRGAVAVVWEPSALYADVRCDLPTVPVRGLSAKVGLIAARFYGNPARDMFTLGVTGTDGKTSTTHLFAQVGEALGHRAGIVGTLGYGTLDELATPTHTTPDPVSLQAWLAKLRALGADCLGVEVSSHALDQGRVNGLPIDVAVFTNLSRDHLDYHGDLQNYARAKRRLFEREEIRAAVFNVGDDFGRQWADELEGAKRVVRVGIGGEVEAGGEYVRAANVELSTRGLAFELQSSWGVAAVESPLLGAFNVRNLLQVAAAWLVQGCALDALVASFARVRTVPGRIEGFRGANDVLVVVDYAHTPGAIGQVLDALKAHTHGQIWSVFGCGGNRDRGKRPQMVAAAAQRSEHLVLTDDNPRFESPQDIVADMVAGLPSRADYVILHDRPAAIRYALERARPGDVVLVAGKGHEDYQQIGDTRVAYSDRQVVRELLHKEDECRA